jgi:hypothetical protein
MSRNPLLDLLNEHAEHPWHQVGRDVYCGLCGVRLYRGKLLRTHAVWHPSGRSSEKDPPPAE